MDPSLDALHYQSMAIDKYDHRRDTKKQVPGLHPGLNDLIRVLGKQAHCSSRTLIVCEPVCPRPVYTESKYHKNCGSPRGSPVGSPKGSPRKGRSRDSLCRPSSLWSPVRPESYYYNCFFYRQYPDRESEYKAIEEKYKAIKEETLDYDPPECDPELLKAIGMGSRKKRRDGNRDRAGQYLGESSMRSQNRPMSLKSGGNDSVPCSELAEIRDLLKSSDRETIKRMQEMLELMRELSLKDMCRATCDGSSPRSTSKVRGAKGVKKHDNFDGDYDDARGSLFPVTSIPRARDDYDYGDQDTTKGRSIDYDGRSTASKGSYMERDDEGEDSEAHEANIGDDDYGTQVPKSGHRKRDDDDFGPQGSKVSFRIRNKENLELQGPKEDVGREGSKRSYQVRGDGADYRSEGSKKRSQQRDVYDGEFGPQGSKRSYRQRDDRDELSPQRSKKRYPGDDVSFGAKGPKESYQKGREDKGEDDYRSGDEYEDGQIGVDPSGSSLRDASIRSTQQSGSRSRQSKGDPSGKSLRGPSGRSVQQSGSERKKKIPDVGSSDDESEERNGFTEPTLELDFRTPRSLHENADGSRGRVADGSKSSLALSASQTKMKGEQPTRRGRRPEGVSESESDESPSPVNSEPSSTHDLSGKGMPDVDASETEFKGPGKASSSRAVLKKGAHGNTTEFRIYVGEKSVPLRIHEVIELSNRIADIIVLETIDELIKNGLYVPPSKKSFEHYKTMPRTSVESQIRSKTSLHRLNGTRDLTKRSPPESPSRLDGIDNSMSPPYKRFGKKEKPSREVKREEKRHSGESKVSEKRSDRSRDRRKPSPQSPTRFTEIDESTAHPGKLSGKKERPVRDVKLEEKRHSRESKPKMSEKRSESSWDRQKPSPSQSPSGLSRIHESTTHPAKPSGKKERQSRDGKREEKRHSKESARPSFPRHSKSLSPSASQRRRSSSCRLEIERRARSDGDSVRHGEPPKPWERRLSSQLKLDSMKESTRATDGRTGSRRTSDGHEKSRGTDTEGTLSESKPKPKKVSQISEISKRGSYKPPRKRLAAESLRESSMETEAGKQLAPGGSKQKIVVSSINEYGQAKEVVPGSPTTQRSKPGLKDSSLGHKRTSRSEGLKVASPATSGRSIGKLGKPEGLGPRTGSKTSLGSKGSVCVDGSATQVGPAKQEKAMSGSRVTKEVTKRIVKDVADLPEGSAPSVRSQQLESQSWESVSADSSASLVEPAEQGKVIGGPQRPREETKRTLKDGTESSRAQGPGGSRLQSGVPVDTSPELYQPCPPDDFMVDPYDVDSSILYYARLTSNAFPPVKEAFHSAGFLLRSAYEYVIPPGSKKRVKTDLVIQVPRNSYGRIAPRKCLVENFGIDVVADVIDRDFLGNVTVVLLNLRDRPYTVQRGHKVAQLICESIHLAKVVENRNLLK